MGIASIRYDRLIAIVQRTISPQKSNQERSSDTREGHCSCGGHGCDCSSRSEGHSDPIRKGYPGDNQRAFKAKDRPKFRHDRSRSGM